MFGFGDKSYFLFTEDRTTGERKLNPQLTKEIKAALGPTRNAIMEQTEQEIRDLEQRVAEDEETAKDNTLSKNVRQAARERVLENFESLEELEKDHEQLGGVLSLRERLKAILSKYGFTSAAVVLAV